MITPESTQIVVFAKARFTVLTERMIRCEWSEDGVFEDLATLTVCNRRTEPVSFAVGTRDRTLSLKTSALTLDYTDDGKPFSKRNLTISLKLNGKTVTWTPGLKDKQNLKGTAKTLDNVNGSMTKKWIPVAEKDPNKPVLDASSRGDWIWQGDMKPLPLCDGLISRAGWAVVDDSSACVLDPAGCDWQPWPRERAPGVRQDLYFLGYGHDYKAALCEGAKIFGRQPLPPRFALGYWYSRYWAYTDKELKQLVEEFESMNLPLDVLVIDMDWHKLGWTGYSWDPDFFPDPAHLLAWLRERGIKITLNLHPADGVFDFEDAFPAMLKEMGLKRAELPDLEPVYHRLYELLGLNPAGAKRIPLNINDPNYMRAYFKCLHHPLEEMGVGFWWMDWQQGRGGSHLPNLDTLPWINELHWQDQVRHRPEQRPINFSRFGGIGAGRMPVGFSGDTIVTWESLAFQPYFTATAANVLYGYWSHDIGGHMGGHLTPELYTRWLQFGQYSPILRTHTTKQIDCERRVFHFPDPDRSVMMQVLRRRYEQVPYLYGEMRKGADTGVSALRPMYYDFPESDDAYRAKDQYFFGEAMIVAPVIAPMDPLSELAEVKVWLPDGEWLDTARSVRLDGGWHRLRYTLAEVPAFVRPGAVLPEQAFTRQLRPGAYPGLRFRIYGGSKGEGSLYEDDGVSTAWEKGTSAVIRCSHARKGKTRTVTLHPAVGDYEGFVRERPVQILLEGMAPPRRVEGAAGFTYDGDTATLCIDLGSVDLRKGREIVIAETEPLPGMKGLMTRLERARALNCQVSPARPVHADERLIVHAAQTGNRITLQPQNWQREIAALQEDLARLPKSLAAYAKAYRDKGEAFATHAATLDKACAMVKFAVRDLT